MRRPWGVGLVALALATVGAGLPASVAAGSTVASGPRGSASSPASQGRSSSAAPRVAPTCTPGQPVVVGSAADRLTVTVPGCANEAGVTGYRVFVLAGAAEVAAAQVDVAAGVVQTEVTGLQAGTLYRFRLGARNVDGVGPLGAKSVDAVSPFTSAGAMVDRQYLDFNGVAATAAQRASWLADLASGAKTPVDLVDGAEQFAFWQKQSPIIRLFQAYFLRLPDKSGLAYWTGKYRGGKPLADISQQFAKSSEFTRRYGTLTNRKFVEQIYLNVLGRPGEESGIVYWTGRLDGTVGKGKATRGAVMVGFSESSEYKRKTAAQVSVVNLFTGMILRLPTTAEVDTWKPQTRAALITFLLGSAAYVARVGVIAPPAVSTTSIPSAAVGTAYSKQLTSVGGTGSTTWSVGSGALPPGITLSAGGLLSGTPTRGGSFTFAAKVTDGAGHSGQRTFTLVIPALTITTTSVPSAAVGTAYPNTQLTAANPFGAVTWSVIGGTLPDGLDLSSAGALSGTPSTGGTSNFTVEVDDAGGSSATKALSITVSTISITTASLPDSAIGATYPSTQLTATNAFGSITWTVQSGALPPGVSLSSSGVVSGSPTSSGTFNVTIKATDDASNTGTKAFTINVSSFAIVTASLPGGKVGVPYAVNVVAAGGSGYSWSITAGGLPAGLALEPATGAITGTPTQSGTGTFTLKVDASGGKTASKQFTIGVTAVADWPQADHDEGGRAWSPSEDIITPANVAGIHEEWSLDSGLSPTIAGGAVYAAGEVPGHPATYAVMALDLTTGDVQWYSQLASSCQGGAVAVTSTAVIVECGNSIQAYQRAGAHSLLWNTADTDPGVSTQSMAVSGSSLVAWGSDRVLVYRLSDGQRLWQQLLPSGAGFINDAAVSGNSVVVAYDDRLRALNYATGAQLWSKPGVVTPSVVVGDGFAYTSNNKGVSRFALADGAPGWAVAAGGSIYRLVGLDGDTVYAWDATFGDFGLESSSFRAFKTADGSERWHLDLSARVRNAAITKDLVWVDESDIYSQGRLTNLIALRRTDGVEQHRVTFTDNSYGEAAFANGHVVFQQGGSFGEATPHALRSYGFTPPRPLIATRMVPTGRTGLAYSTTLAATGGAGTLKWTVTSGSLPAGLALSTAGVLSGTPTAAGSVRVQVKVTDANGRSQTKGLRVEVLGASIDGFNRWGHDGTLDGYNRGETTIGRDVAAQIGLRWKTAVPAGSAVTVSDNHAPIVVGNRMYDLDALGRLSAWDTAGNATNRAPLWTRAPFDSSAAYFDGPTESGGVLYLIDTTNFLDAVNATTGARIWRHAISGVPDYHNHLLVQGGKILIVNNAYDVEAYNTSDGSPAWGGAVTDLGTDGLTITSVLSTDGTRAFALAECKVVAITIATGAVAWSVPITAGGTTNCGMPGKSVPTVADGAVFAGSYDGTIAIEAATGSVRWRSGTHAFFGEGAGVVANGAWVFSNGYSDDGNLIALDVANGDVLWQNTQASPLMTYSVAGDLVIGRSYSSIQGFDLLTGELIWDGGAPDSNQWYAGPAAISGGRIYIGTTEGTKVYGLP